MTEPIIPRHGGYRKLKSFQIARLVYDVTVHFCAHFVDKRNRTYDQMVQAARSGVQNIAEGSQASSTSSKTEMKLTNVARASLEELRLDYEDYLRQRTLPLWERNDVRRAALIELRPTSTAAVGEWVRMVGAGNTSTESTRSTESTESTKRPSRAEIAANGALALINVACALLDRQIASQSAAFEESGGFAERLYARRRDQRDCST